MKKTSEIASAMKEWGYMDSTLTPPEKEVIANFYNSFNLKLNDKEFGKSSLFFNLGYVPNSNPQYSNISLPKFCLQKNAKKLVLEVIADCSLDNADILDVGCGRGGTLSIINKYFKPRSLSGIDLSQEAINFCNKTHEFINPNFVSGDAEALPFPDHSFDVVTNVESSHCYPNIRSFYTEVYRVLKPSGYFLYTDMISTETIPKYVNFLEMTGFSIERAQDITANVMLSCQQIPENQVSLIANDDPETLELAGEFLSVENSQCYADFKNNRVCYMVYKIKKL